MHEAKTQLSRLIERVLQGEDVIIAKAGKPVARLVRFQQAPKRLLGSAAGTIEFAPGWEAPMTESELQEFLGQ